MVLGKKIFKSFSHYKPMADNDAPRLDPPVTIGRNYIGANLTLLLTKYKSSGPHGFREEDFCYIFSNYKSMEANDPPGCGQLGPQGHDWQDL